MDAECTLRCTREFFDQWVQWLGYDYWDWGIAAAWFAGGSVLFGVMKLFRERKEQRTAAADAFIVYRDWRSQDNSEATASTVWTVRAENRGNAPIFSAFLLVRAENGWTDFYFEGPVRWKKATFGPGETNEARVIVSGIDPERIIACFVDKSGATWFRDVETGRLLGRAEEEQLRAYFAHELPNIFIDQSPRRS